MDHLEMFDVLEMKETTDKDAIKTAYRNLLVKVNPEDDPVGFMRLRRAYENAIRFCDVGMVNKEEKEEETSVSMWMSKIKQTYESFQERIDESVWTTLLSDEICLELDTCNEAREKLLAFIMSHNRIPKSIFILIDNVFHIEKDVEELSVLFPKKFLDYFIYQVHHRDFINYSLFEVEEGVDYDSFLNEFYVINKKIIDSELDDVWKLIINIERFQIYHPYLDVMRIKYIMALQRRLDAAVTRLSGKYQEDLFIQYHIAYVKWEKGDYDAAYEIAKHVLKADPDEYYANFVLIEYLFMQGEYETAKEICKKQIKLFSTKERQNQLVKINSVLIEQYQERIVEEPGNLDLAMKLGWCYYENERYGECMDLLERSKPDEAHWLTYHSLKGRNFVSLKQYREALPHLEAWENAIVNLVDNGSKEAKEKKSRYTLSRYLQAICYQELGIEESKKEYFEKALECLDFDIRIVDNHNQKRDILTLKARLYLNLEQGQKSVDICNELIAMDEYYFFQHYLLLQEAYYQLKDGQKVIQTFYKIFDIFPYDVKSYVLTIKTFYSYGQFDDAKRIIEMAREIDRPSNEIDLLEIKVLHAKAKTADDIRVILVLCEDLEQKLNDEKNDIEDITEFYYLRADCFMQIGEYRNALYVIDKFITDNAAEEDAYRLRGKILYNLGEYKKALELFQDYIRENETDSEYLYQMAACLEEVKEQKT